MVDRRALRRRAEAGHWVLRLQEDQLSEAQIEAWLTWSADEENLAAFESLQSLYTTMRRRPALRGVGPRTPSRRRWTRASRASRRALLALAASLLLVLGLLVWQPAQPPSEQAAQTYLTAKGVHREVRLPDGSQAILGANSKLTVTYNDRRRDVRVDAGEVYFRVRKDTRWPFVVEAGGLAITAVGTAFDVRRSDDQIEVTVEEGVVDTVRQPLPWATAGGQMPHVRAQAGERVTMNLASSVLTTASVAPAAAAAWRDGRLEFAGESLRLVIANVNRYLASDIQIGDAEVGRWIYSGTVQPDHVDEWLEALQVVFPIRVVRRADGSVILLRAPGQP